jgi:diguanylate cyclase (GGDEF)-like protein
MLAGQAELIAQVLRSDDKRAALGAARAGLGRELGLTAAQVDGLVADVGARVKEVGHELGFRVGKQPAMEEILAAANAGLVELNLTYEELVGRLEKALAETEALSKELAARNRELEQLSVTDPMTSLPNRRALSGRLNYELGKAAREHTSVAFVMGDIDRFKLINDTWGHDFGDVVLEETARVLRLAADGQFACRMGGEEFGIVLPGVTPVEAARVAERLRALLAGRDVVCPDGVARRFTISVGVAWMAEGAPASVDPDAVAAALYKNADRALYEAKRQGRDRVVASTEATPWAAAPRAA